MVNFNLKKGEFNFDYTLYDGTFEGLLTCIYDGFYYKTTISGIYNKKLNDIPLLLENIIDVNTDLIKFSKVKSLKR